MSVYQVTIRNVYNWINNSLSKTKFLNIQLTKLLKQFLALASSHGIMKSKQVIKRYSLQTINYVKDCNHVHPSFCVYRRLGRLKAASLSE